MMDTLIMIVKSLVILAFLSLFLEMLLPSGSTKKYAKFVMGLLMLVVMINPILQLAHSDLPKVISVDEVAAAGASTDDILADGEALRQGMEEDALTTYEKEMAAAVQDELADFDTVQAVAVQLGKDGEQVQSVDLLVTLKSDAGDGDTAAIRRQAEAVLAEKFGLQAADVRVSFKKVAD